WAIDRGLARRCVNALAAEAALVQQMADAEVGRPYPGRRSIDEIESEAASVVRRRFSEADAVRDDAYSALDTTRWFGAECNGRILAILGQAPTEPAAIAAFQRLAGTLVAWWDSDDDHRRDRRERDHETESASTDLLKHFLLRTSAAAAITIVAPIL